MVAAIGWEVGFLSGGRALGGSRVCPVTTLDAGHSGERTLVGMGFSRRLGGGLNLALGKRERTLGGCAGVAGGVGGAAARTMVATARYRCGPWTRPLS